MYAHAVAAIEIIPQSDPLLASIPSCPSCLFMAAVREDQHHVVGQVEPATEMWPLAAHLLQMSPVILSSMHGIIGLRPRHHVQVPLARPPNFSPSPYPIDRQQTMTLCIYPSRP